MRKQRDSRFYAIACLPGAIAIAIATATAPPARAGGGPPLPIPCAPGACGATGASKFVTGGAATAVATPNSLTINQTSNSAILNWASFDIASGNSVNFVQPSASAIALNRIFAGNPSQIFGKLNANGQIYLVNLNGFVFGATSSVNVGSLLVSSLPLALTDANFANGILSPLQNGGQATFDASLDPLAPGGRTSVLDVNGKPVLDDSGKPLAVQVLVQPGAQITAADQGRILLAGQEVTNGGTLTAPDGQVLLAAGTKIFLQADTDPGLRGLVVEVDGTTTTAADGTQTTNTAWNQLTGTLSAPRGNVSMVGLAVNQDGRISATTSVSANGSIRLEAAGGANVAFSSGGNTVASSKGGALTIGPQSDMSIDTDSSGGTAVAAQTQLPSAITLLGEQVDIQGGSITAPGGTLTVIAAANPSQAATAPASSASSSAVAGVTSTPDPNARLHIDAGTSIDLSGSTASLPVTANLVSGQLRSSELENDPTQRNGLLHGDTVYIDVLQGSPPIANLSGEIAAVPETIQQRTEAGGHATFQSEGDLVFSSGATLNVSGGASTYAGGVLQTTYLIGANGHLYPIATANPLLTYVGVVNPTFTQNYNTWGVQDVVATPGLSFYQPGYVQGAAGGSVQFAAGNMVLQGRLYGNTVDGLYQRTPATVAAASQLIVGVPGGLANSTTTGTDFLAPAIELTNSPIPIEVADNATLSGPQTLQLPASYLTGSGFTSISLNSNGDVSLPANLPLQLPAGSSLAVSALRLDILSGITDPGGSLQLQNVLTAGAAAAGTPTAAAAARPGVYIGNDVTLDVRGQWTNDLASINGGVPNLAQTWQNGGSILLSTSSPGSLLSVGDNVNLHASGGAWLQSNGSTAPGTGGSIALNANGLGGGLDVGHDLAVDAFGVNGARGGSFALAAPRLEISNGTPGSWTTAQNVDDASMSPGGVMQLYSGLFSDYGFQNYSLTATALVAAGAATNNVLTIDPGTQVAATVTTLYVNPSAPRSASAANLTGLSAVATLPSYQLYQDGAAGIKLGALPNPTGGISTFGTTDVGDVFIGAGANISTAPGGSIGIEGLDSIIVNGTLRAPGGAVSLEVLNPGASKSPYENYEAGFLPTQRIELGASAVIDVSGALERQPSVQGLNLGTLLPGGSVDLFADRGFVLADAGSTIAIAGASAPLDVLQSNGSYSHELAASAGGSITARSGEAISLLGTVEASAGSGGTSGTAAAGSLEIDLTRGQNWWGYVSPAAAASFNQAPLTIELEPTVPAGTPSSPANTNQAVLGAAQLAQSGLDALTLQSGNVVELSGNFALNLGRQLIIDAPVIEANTQATARLSAPYLQVGYTSQPEVPNTAVAQPGTGTLTFNGNEIDLDGITVFQGASSVTFSSSGDLKLVGAIGGQSATQAYLSGGLTLEGSVQLDAARIYPTTGTSFSINALENPATGVPGLVTIGQNGASPGTPLSADGTVSINAYDITSTGTLYAPFGSVTLTGTNGVTLGDGSLTSVSGNGLVIPFGSTQFSQAQWTYLFDYTASPGSALQTITGIPNRAVNLTAPNIAIAANATIDLAGGGDLSAYEWVPGPGGSTDALAPGVTPGLYAVLPSTRGEAAPQDAQDTDPSLAAGASVYLSGSSGLAAGTYPLLPARYALLPGAYLVQAEPGFRSTSAGTLGNLMNGAPVVAGYLTYGSTGLHQTPGYEGFAVYPGSYGSQLAQYDISLASSFFSTLAAATEAPRPALPADAGSLSIAVGNSLTAAGTVQTAAAAGGLGAPVQIAAADLYIGTATTAPPGNTVSISDALLNSWQPGSLLLGGELTAEAANTGTTSSATVSPPPGSTSSINVLANNVTLGAGSSLHAPQVVVVANQAIDVQGGAMVQSTSAVAGSAPATLPAQQLVTLSNTDAALLSVSDANWLIPQHPAGAASAPSTASASGGTINLQAGATLASRSSISVDAVGGIALNGTLMGPGAEFSLGSSSIALGAASSSDALSISNTLLTELGGAGALRLASTGPIDIEAPVSLGVGGSSPTLNALTLQASSLNNLGGATATQFGAQLLTLQGAGATQATAAQGGPAGSALNLVADTVVIGPNVLTVNGFAATHAAASGPIIGQCAATCSGGLAVGGDLLLTASGLTTTSGASTALSAAGALTVAAAPAGGALPQYLGGTLTLSGNSIDVAGRLSAPSGVIDLLAANDLTVDSGANISAAGSVVSIGNQSASAPAGTISATAGGSLTLSPGATLDVSGAGNAAAGTISLAATGAASIGATLNGAGANGAAGGSFALDAGSLAAPAGMAGNPLTALAAALAPGAGSAGGFDTAIDIRVRTGSLTLDGASNLTANTVNLTADTGSVLVEGQIFAPSGNLRGNLSIFGGSGVDIASGAVLRADGSGAQGLGGSIEIGAGTLVADAAGLLDQYNNAAISLDAGSTISAAGSGGNGTLLLRAPALIAANDVAITSLAADTSAVGQIVIEPILPFNTAGAAFSSATAPSAGDFQNIGQTVMTYWNAANGNISARLGGATPLTVEPGVEIIAPGALTLPALDFVANQTFYNNTTQAGIPVDLTVRAAGNIEVAGVVSDGFNVQQVGDDGNGVFQPTLLSTPSSSFRLVAGADLTSANPLAVVGVGAAAGNLVFDNGALVRTGTGSIDLVAAGNLTLAGPGSGAYTAGLSAVAPGGSGGPNGTPYPGVSNSKGTTAPDTDNNGTSITYGMFIPDTSVLASYPTAGGNLTVRTGGDITNSSTTSAGSVTAWQVRESASSEQSASWGVNLAAYDWNFGTLGGGDLRIAAVGSAINISAAAAGSLLPQAAGATPAYVTSGGLSFTAGQNIGSAQVYLANGTGTVSTGGMLSATLPATVASTAAVGSAFYLQSSVINVNARTGVSIDGIFDPESLAQPPPLVDGLTATPGQMAGSLYSYGENSALNVQSVTGDIDLGSSSVAGATLLGAATSHANSPLLEILPASLTLGALNGNIGYGGSLGTPILYPSASGQLDLLAAQNIAYIGAPGGGRIIMSDAAAGSVATATDTPSNPVSLGSVFGGNLHANDPDPVLVTAGGSIKNVALVIPKAAELVAGLDVSNLTYTGQNFNAQDLTLISAGRDFLDTTGGAISLGGPGSLDILAGRNIELGFSQGVVTTGNLLNANLPTPQGASITMMTGLGTAPTYANFVGKIVETSTAYENDLVNYVESVQGTSGLTVAAAESAFGTFGINQQRPLIDEVFFDVLSASGLADNTVPGAGFTAGYAAIDALFPGSRSAAPGYMAGAYGGDLTLQFSRIYTLSGGDINLLVPGGGIDVGLANPPATLASRPPSTLGIVTEEAGDVNVYTQGDVNVNSSRVFTLGGGNILIWSNQGSIDAGLGAKTSVSAPPPSILINSDGTVTINFSGAATGSGIRTIQTEPTTPAGNVDLIAPVGTVNAGDAGIGAAGNINIAAQSVIGVTNISFGGTATGVPALVSNVSASLSGAANAATGASTTATNSVTGEPAEKDTAPLAQSALSWLDVFVTGLGEENCKPDDIECLKRQKTMTR